ncbi:MAG: XVIPCD domain-containing protein [Silanimonas sp.]
MSRYTIRESVGSRVETETTFRGLEKHHPSSGREPGRDYATIDGELEEIRRTSDGRTLIKKDFFLTRDDGGRIDIPAPAAGYIHYLNDSTNAVRIYDRPFGEPGARLLAQSLHMERGTSPPQGSRIEYGQPMGRMGDTGSPGSVHAHVEAEHGQFTRYIADIAAGRIAPGVWPARGNAPAPGAPTAPGGAMADGVLRHGEEGTPVRSLQLRLNELGMRDARGQPLVPDGDFGDRTKEAVERFQRSRGITDDGIVGRDTFRELGEAVRERSQGRTGATPTAPTAPGGTLQPSRLSNLIGSGEGGYNSYNRGVAGDSGGREIDFSQMTVGEIMRRQDLPRNDPQRLFAVGKFQIIPGTMEETVRALGIDRNARFTPELQERMFHDYLIDEKRPAVRAFITAPDGQGTPALQQRAQIALAQEFASVADPRTGRSYYDGDSAGNASSITARQSAEALAAMRAEYRAAIARGESPAEAWQGLGTGAARRVETPAPATPTVTPGREPDAPQRSVLTGREAPLLTAADHPDRALMQQARAGVDRLPPGVFATDREREQAAAALVFEAKIAGLTRIDAVTPNVSGTGVFAVQGRPDDPGAQRVYVDRAQAASQTVEQSSQMLRQAMPAAPAAVVAPDPVLDESRRAVALRGVA